MLTSATEMQSKVKLSNATASRRPDSLGDGTAPRSVDELMHRMARTGQGTATNAESGGRHGRAAHSLRRCSMALRGAREVMAWTRNARSRNATTTKGGAAMTGASLLRVKLDDYGFEPTRAHATDAGLDLRTPCDVMLMAGQSATIGTGVHVELPPGTCGLIVSKSGLNLRGITTTGLIDEGYTGEVKVTVRNHGTSTVVLNRGDKVSQLVVLPYVACDVELVDEISGGERGDAGFGSTGR